MEGYTPDTLNDSRPAGIPHRSTLQNDFAHLELSAGLEDALDWAAIWPDADLNLNLDASQPNLCEPSLPTGSQYDPRQNLHPANTDPSDKGTRKAPSLSLSGQAKSPLAKEGELINGSTVDSVVRATRPGPALLNPAKELPTQDDRILRSGGSSGAGSITRQVPLFPDPASEMSSLKLKEPKVKEDAKRLNLAVGELAKFRFQHEGTVVAAEELIVAQRLSDLRLSSSKLLDTGFLPIFHHSRPWRHGASVLDSEASWDDEDEGDDQQRAIYADLNAFRNDQHRTLLVTGYLSRRQRRLFHAISHFMGYAHITIDSGPLARLLIGKNKAKGFFFHGAATTCLLTLATLLQTMLWGILVASSLHNPASSINHPHAVRLSNHPVTLLAIPLELPAMGSLLA
jgi:hypothetical protein